MKAAFSLSREIEDTQPPLTGFNAVAQFLDDAGNEVKQERFNANCISSLKSLIVNEAGSLTSNHSSITYRTWCGSLEGCV